MTVKRLVAILIIFMSALSAWMILGVSNLMRTNDMSVELRNEIQSLYGGAKYIRQPEITYDRVATETITNENGKIMNRNVTVSHPVPLDSSEIQVDLKIDYRQKGVLWFPTYKQAIRSVYTFSNPFAARETIYFAASLDNSDSIYDDVKLTVNGKEQKDIRSLLNKSRLSLRMDPNGKTTVELSYRTTGMWEWYYYITWSGDSVGEINNFRLQLNTDFKVIDFPNGTMSPTVKEETKDGWKLVWDLKRTITGKDIGLVIPNRLNPGEITSRVIFFAPIPLLFYFFLLIVLSILFKVEIHPMNFLFLAAAFFSFHLIFSYFSDQLNIYLTFALASVVSMALASSYLRIFTPFRFAFVFSPLMQLIYLVAFSFSFFFKGISGMILTVVSVITLFVVMQMTGKVDWSEVFKPKNKN